MIAIHPIHRRMAEIIYMSTDQRGNTVIGVPEMQLLIPLLRQNLELVRRLDELKSLALEAQVSGDTEWVQDICQKIDQIEVTCL